MFTINVTIVTLAAIYPCVIMALKNTALMALSSAQIFMELGGEISQKCNYTRRNIALLLSYVCVVRITSLSLIDFHIIHKSVVDSERESNYRG